MNLLNEIDRTRLFKAMHHSYTKLEPFRQLRTGLIEEYAGSSYGYGSGAAKFETMMNLMNQAVVAYTMSLVANRPRVTVDTNREALKFFAHHYQVAINNMLQEIEIERVLRSAVVDAFFSVGIVKTHMADAAEVELWDGVLVDPGQPWASSVSLDDWVHDMSATRWDQIQFASDGYRVPIDDLKSPQFDQAIVAELTPTAKMSFAGSSQRVDMLSSGYHADSEDVEQMVDLMDVWIPKERKIYTFAIAHNSRFSTNHPPLCVMDWDGPEMGPYHLLSFDDVPENIMPTSPAAHLASLSRLANNLLRKQARQAKRQKDVHTYTPAGAEAAKKHQRSSDGDYIEVQDTGDLNVIRSGGANPQNHAFLLHIVDVFDRMAGNLPAMLGLGPQADTLGQEQLIQGSVSKKEAQLRLRCMDFTRKLVRNLSYMLWNDVAKVIPGRMPVPGVEGASIDATWTPEFRMGQYHDYDLDVDVFSMPYQAPGQKASALTQLLMQVYLPAMPMLQAQGGQINLQAMTDIFAELMNLPKLKDIVQFSTPLPGRPPEGAGNNSMPPPQTTRNYVRRSVPTGGTVQGRSTSMQQQLMAQVSNPAPQ